MQVVFVEMLVEGCVAYAESCKDLCEDSIYWECNTTLTSGPFVLS